MYAHLRFETRNHSYMSNSLNLVTCYLSQIMFTNNQNCLIHLYEPEIGKNIPSFILDCRYSWMSIRLRCDWGHFEHPQFYFNYVFPVENLVCKWHKLLDVFLLPFDGGHLWMSPSVIWYCGCLQISFQYQDWVCDKSCRKNASVLIPCKGRRINGTPCCISKWQFHYIMVAFVSRVFLSYINWKYIICDNWHINLISMSFVYLCGGFLLGDCRVYCTPLLSRNVSKLKITRDPSHWEFIISRYKLIKLR